MNQCEGRPIPTARLASLDLVRTAATVCVVLIHVTRKLYVFEPDHINALNFRNQMVAIGGFSLGSVGVPLFLMLTGYLLLNREYDESGVRSFYLQHFIRLLVVWEIWVLIYDVFLCWFGGTSFDTATYIRRALFLQYAGMEHAWYMPMILGVYLFLPFVSIALHRMSGRLLLAIMAVEAVICMVIPAAAVFQTALGMDHVIYSSVDLDFGGGFYGVYLCIGYLSARYHKRLRRWLCGTGAAGHRCLLILSALAGLAGAMGMQRYLYSIGYLYLLSYDNILLCIAGGSIFWLLLSVPVPKRCCSLLKKTSQDAFGVFLLHEFFLVLLFRCTEGFTHRYLAQPALTIGIYLASVVLTEILSCIPYVKGVLYK